MYRTKSSPLSARVLALSSRLSPERGSRGVAALALFLVLLAFIAAPWPAGLAFAATSPYEQDPGTRGTDPEWPPGPPGEDGSDPDELEIYITIPGPGAEFGSHDAGRPNGRRAVEPSTARLRMLATWVLRQLVTHH